MLVGVLLTGHLPATQSAEAATFDPDLTWRTLRTEHFHIHFHQGLEAVANDVAGKVEPIYARMTAELGWQPAERTHVVLVDRTDDANGFAGTVPYNAITLFVTAPQEDGTLSQYEDWAHLIVTHELTHILHIDTNHGLIRLGRWVFGRVASSNRLSTRWMVEGLATFEETRHTATGRGRSAYVRMLHRAAVVADAFPDLGVMDGNRPDPPAGNLRYLWGQDFIQWVADHQGRDVWRAFVHDYGASVPFFFPGQRKLGAPLPELYRRWRADREAELSAEVDALRSEAPFTTSSALTDGPSSCRAPTYSPDGAHLVWSCVDRRTGSAIWIADGDGGRVRKLAQDRGAKAFTWRPDSRGFAYAGVHLVNRFNAWSDLYLATLDEPAQTISVTSLTQGARARDPAFSPDGQRLWMVTNKAQTNQLEVLTVDRSRTRLTDFGDHTQLATPRFHPAGDWAAVSVWREGRRDLWLADGAGRLVRRLTRDRAIDRDPWWSTDGATLFFSSDRTGVPNVFALDVATERLWQVTHVATGAVHPTVSPDGTRIAWQQYRNDGWQIRLAELDRTTWRDRGQLAWSPADGPPLAELVGLPVDAAWFEPSVSPPPDWEEAGEPLGDAVPGVPVEPGPLGELHPVDRQDGGGLDSFDQIEVEGVHGAEIDDYPFRTPPRRYSPWSALLPRYWVPFVQTTPFPSIGPLAFLQQAPDELAFLRDAGLVVGGSTTATDPLRHVSWSASATYRSDAHYLGAAGSITYNRWIPVVSVGVAHNAVPSVLLFAPPADGQTPTVDDAIGRYWEKRTDLRASVSYPYTNQSWVFGEYRLSFREPLFDLPADVWKDQVPVRGRIATLSGGWRYAWSQPTGYAISAEDARVVQVVGRLLHPWLGADTRDADEEPVDLLQVQLAADWREYLVNPWAPNHVLALRVSSGLSLGDATFLGNYQLGGPFGDSTFTTTPDSLLMVRGYPIGASTGDSYWLTSLEYRLPLFRVDRGLGVLPVYGDAVSAAAFVDAGQAFGVVNAPLDGVGTPLVGVGAEIRFTAVLAYNNGLSGRLGFASGLTGPGYRPVVMVDGNPVFDSRVFYFQVGGAF